MMNKKNFTLALLVDMALIGLAFLITPTYLGMIFGWISGFINLESNIVAFIILSVFLFYPAFLFAKIIVKSQSN